MLYKLFHYFSLLQFTLNVGSSLLMWKGVSSAPEAIMILKIWFVSDITYDVIPEVKKFWIMGYKSASWIKLSTAPSLLLPSKFNDASFIVWFSHCNPLSAPFSTLEMVVLARIYPVAAELMMGLGLTFVLLILACCLSSSHFLSCLRFKD